MIKYIFSACLLSFFQFSANALDSNKNREIKIECRKEFSVAGVTDNHKLNFSYNENLADIKIDSDLIFYTGNDIQAGSIKTIHYENHIITFEKDDNSKIFILSITKDIQNPEYSDPAKTIEHKIVLEIDKENEIVLSLEDDDLYCSFQDLKKDKGSM